MNFFPGPSRVYQEVGKYMQDAFKEGILSVNHRSVAFMSVCEKTANLMHEKLNIPSDYKIFFTSSSTECWEILAQSLTQSQSHHVYSGAFGKKWFEYAQKINTKSTGQKFGHQDSLENFKIEIPTGAEWLCITHNETSNGTQVHHSTLKKLREQYPEILIAADATSSLGGVDLHIENADFWHSSVQKCFGLPAGLGIMICSPNAMKKAEHLADNKFYNSLLSIAKNMETFQTAYTPNVLNIYLLMRVLEDMPSITKLEEKTIKRYKSWHKFLAKFEDFQPLTSQEGIDSYTVVCVKATPEKVKEVLDKGKKAGILIGGGYGDIKPETFRIANFPAIKGSEIKGLKNFLKENFK